MCACRDPVRGPADGAFGLREAGTGRTRIPYAAFLENPITRAPWMLCHVYGAPFGPRPRARRSEIMICPRAVTQLGTSLKGSCGPKGACDLAPSPPGRYRHALATAAMPALLRRMSSSQVRDRIRPRLIRPVSTEGVGLALPPFSISATGRRGLSSGGSSRDVRHRGEGERNARPIPASPR